MGAAADSAAHSALSGPPAVQTIDGVATDEMLAFLATGGKCAPGNYGPLVSGPREARGPGPEKPRARGPRTTNRPKHGFQPWPLTAAVSPDTQPFARLLVNGVRPGLQRACSGSPRLPGAGQPARYSVVAPLQRLRRVAAGSPLLRP